MDDYDEVDFWGGESPSARQMSPSLSRAAGTDGNEMAVDVDDHEKGEEESDDGEDSEDEVMIEGMDEDDEDEPGGPMSMDLIGHR